MSDQSNTDTTTEEERRQNLASVPAGAEFPYHKGGGWYVTEEGDIVQGDPDEDEPRAAGSPGDQAALGTPQVIEKSESDKSDVERLAEEHAKRNSLERVNRDGYTPGAPHPSEREPNPAFGRRYESKE